MALEQSAAGGKELLAGKPQRALYFWALNRAMPANLSKISTGVNSKRTSIIREESQKKKKGKEDVCSVHQCFVCNAIAGYKSPRDHPQLQGLKQGGRRKSEPLRGCTALGIQVKYCGILVNVVVCIL